MKFWNKKIFKYRLENKSLRKEQKYRIIYGNWGIKSLHSGLISSQQLENTRRKIARLLKILNVAKINKTKIFVRVLLWKPYTTKPKLSRMGKGAGIITKWRAYIRPGYFLFELLVKNFIPRMRSLIKKALSSFLLKTVLIQNT